MMTREGDDAPTDSGGGASPAERPDMGRDEVIVEIEVQPEDNLGDLPDPDGNASSDGITTSPDSGKIAFSVPREPVLRDLSDPAVLREIAEKAERDAEKSIARRRRRDPGPR